MNNPTILTVAFLRLMQRKANKPLRFSGKCNRTHAFFLLHLFEKRKVCLLSVALAEKRNGLVLSLFIQRWGASFTPKSRIDDRR